MKLTTQEVERFRGGQMQIENLRKGYLYRGEIEAIVVEEDELKAKFTWLAKGEGFPPAPKKWVMESSLNYTARLALYMVNDIGPSDHGIGGDNRLCLNSFIIGEVAILFPPNGSKLNPANVEGLQLLGA